MNGFNHFLLTFLIIITSQTASATTVLQLDIDDLLAQSEFIFEGEVINSQARWNNSRTMIHTFITFEVRDVLKGNYSEQTIELRFDGGSIDKLQLKIAEMEYPEVGDRGIYFVESLSRKQVNPLLGWTQGELRIVKDQQGTERITSADLMPVQSISQGQALSTANSRTESLPLNKGLAKGLKTARTLTDLQSSMDKPAFKQALRSKLEDLRRAGRIK